MKAWNVTREVLEEALTRTNRQWGWNVRWKKHPELKGKSWQFSVTVVDSKKPGGRVSRDEEGHRVRRIAAACWHVHRDFMVELYRLSPNMVLDTPFVRYEGCVDFAENYEATFDRNCQSEAVPCKYGKSCECLDNA